MANRNKRILYTLAFILLLIPAAAYANMGSRLLIAGISHLIIGNLFIGLIEGLLLTLVFKAKRLKATLVMTLANYLSALIGWCAIICSKGLFEGSSVTIYNAQKMMWMGVAVLMLGTIVFEYPFCIWAMKRDKQSRQGLLKKAILASVLAQVLSYGLLIPYYISIGQASLCTKLKLDSSSAIAGGVNATVYYIGLDGDVYTIGIDDKNRRKIIDANIKNEYAWLVAKKSPKADSWDLMQSDGKT